MPGQETSGGRERKKDDDGGAGKLFGNFLYQNVQHTATHCNTQNINCGNPVRMTVYTKRWGCALKLDDNNTLQQTLQQKLQQKLQQTATCTATLCSVEYNTLQHTHRSYFQI